MVVSAMDNSMASQRPSPRDATRTIRLPSEWGFWIAFTDPIILTAEATGVSKRAVQLATSRAKAIPEDVRAQIKGTKLDTGTYLDSLKGMEPDEQRGAVRRCIYSGSIG